MEKWKEMSTWTKIWTVSLTAVLTISVGVVLFSLIGFCVIFLPFLSVFFYRGK